MYEDFFFHISSKKLFAKDLEVMFVLFAKIARFISNDSAVMFTFIAIYIYYFVYNVIVKRVKSYELAIFLFITFGFYTNSLNILRQWMAIPLLFKAFDMFADDKTKKGVLCIILAILAHYTVIYITPILFLIYWIKNDKINNFIVGLSIILYAFSPVVTEVLRYILVNLNFSDKYIKYLSYSQISTNVFVMPMFTLVSYIGFKVFLKNYNYETESDKKFYRYIVNFTVFGFMTALLGCKFMFFERLQYYFIPSIIFLIPKIISNMQENTKKGAYLFCIIMGTLFYMYSLNKNGGEPLPYQTIFQKTIV